MAGGAGDSLNFPPEREMNRENSSILTLQPDHDDDVLDDDDDDV